MEPRKPEPWSNPEIQTFLLIVGEEWVQDHLNGAHRNEFVYRKVSEEMAERGFCRTWLQCRDKHKKMKSDYQKIKLHNSTSGSVRKDWRWFGLMDNLYGDKPAISGREAGHNSAPSLLRQSVPLKDVASCSANGDTASLRSQDCTPSPCASQSPQPGSSSGSTPASTQPATPVSASAQPPDTGTTALCSLSVKTKLEQEEPAIVACPMEIHEQDREQPQLDREQQQGDREQPRLDREQQQGDREQQRLDREQQQLDREQQRLDREQQRLDREQQQLDREQQRLDREQQRLGREQQRLGREQRPEGDGTNYEPERLNREQRDEQMRKASDEARLARAALALHAQKSQNFNNALLEVLGRLADAISAGRR